MSRTPSGENDATGCGGAGAGASARKRAATRAPIAAAFAAHAGSPYTPPNSASPHARSAWS
jgi:hypothetical protein